MVKQKKSLKQNLKKPHMVTMDTKATMRSHSYFLGLLAVFAGFSLYAIFSFAGSTNNYINGMYASVVGDAQEPVVDESYQIFTDVKSDGFHAVAIEKLKDLGIIGGYADGSFKPDNLTTRGEVLAILETAADTDFSGASYGDCFKDVKNEWFAVPVCYAQKQGWVNGMKDGKFKPNDVVRYPEALKLSLTVFGFKVPATVAADPMAGVKSSDWYAPYFQTAIDFGIIDATFVFDPNYKLTRADFAEIVYQAMKAKKMFE